MPTEAMSSPTNHPAMSDASREAFEAWDRRHFNLPTRDYARYEEGYSSIHVNARWAAWQAASQRQQEEVQRLREALESAVSQVQEFKARWMALPPFADKINKATREGMTMAHMPIIQLEDAARAALESKQ